MSWNTLGIITVSTDWQVINQATSASTFRVSFLGDLERTWYFARMRQYYGADEVSLSTRIYPKRESIILGSVLKLFGILEWYRRIKK